MSYAQFGTIQASDFNTLVGGNPTTTSGTLNAVWATGGSAAGYGQTAVANVTAGQTVASTAQWTALVANTASAATHQGTSITAVTAPASGGTVITMPALGESVSEGTVTRWLKNVGDSVAVDEALLEVSTDKVDTEIPSPVAGVLLAIDVPVDTTVPVGARLALVGAAGGAVASTPAPAAPAPVAAAPVTPPPAPTTPAPVVAAPVTPPPAPVVPAAPAAPVAIGPKPTGLGFANEERDGWYYDAITKDWYTQPQ